MSSPDSWRQLPKIKTWENRLLDQGCSIEALEPLNLLRKPGGDLLFALIHATGKDPDGIPLLPFALLRGSACVIVPICRHASNAERRFLMIRQRRIGHGGLSLEFPAGMLDDDPDPLATALRELAEETGIVVTREDLVPLWDKELFSSPGLTDESIHFFTVEVKLSDEAWQALEGQKRGEAEEGEQLTTTLATFSEASKELTSLQALMGFLLYFRRFGEIT